MAGSGGWDDERIEYLKQMWAKGLSASKIGLEMRKTRNAIIGKVNRLGLADRSGEGPHIHNSRQRSRVATARRKELEARKARPWTGEKSAPPPKPDYVPYKLAPEAIVVEPKNRRGVVDLEPDQCRWPIGDVGEPDFHFCDRTNIPGRVYCGHHCSVAYPVETPKRSAVDFPVRAPDETVEELETAS